MQHRYLTWLGGHRGVLALVTAALGIALIGWAAMAQVSAPQPRPAGRIIAAGPAAGPSQPPTGGPADGASTGASETASGNRSDGTERPLPPSRPVSISIPAIDVESAVFPIGKTRGGRLAVPQPGPNLNKAAWYKHSPTPGQPGPSIIEGHVDSAQGPSVFFELGDIAPGDRIYVTRKDTIRVEFTVDAVRDFKKSRFPTRLVYGGDLSIPQLRLITCSDYVAAIQHHVGNEVVFSHLTDVRPKR